MVSSKITVYVAYAKPDMQIEIPVHLSANGNVALAIRQSGILLQCPELSLPDLQVGIFGKRVPLDACVVDQDRVEIYRPLLIDPKQARLLRLARKKPEKK